MYAIQRLCVFLMFLCFWPIPVVSGGTPGGGEEDAPTAPARSRAPSSDTDSDTSDQLYVGSYENWIKAERKAATRRDMLLCAAERDDRLKQQARIDRRAVRATKTQQSTAASIEEDEGDLMFEMDPFDEEDKSSKQGGSA